MGEVAHPAGQQFTTACVSWIYTDTQTHTHTHTHASSTRTRTHARVHTRSNLPARTHTRALARACTRTHTRTCAGAQMRAPHTHLPQAPADYENRKALVQQQLALLLPSGGRTSGAGTAQGTGGVPTDAGGLVVSEVDLEHGADGTSHRYFRLDEAAVADFQVRMTVGATHGKISETAHFRKVTHATTKLGAGKDVSVSMRVCGGGAGAQHGRRAPQSAQGQPAQDVEDVQVAAGGSGRWGPPGPPQGAGARGEADGAVRVPAEEPRAPPLHGHLPRGRRCQGGQDAEPRLQ